MLSELELGLGASAAYVRHSCYTLMQTETYVSRLLGGETDEGATYDRHQKNPVRGASLGTCAYVARCSFSSPEPRQEEQMRPAGWLASCLRELLD